MSEILADEYEAANLRDLAVWRNEAEDCEPGARVTDDRFMEVDLAIARHYMVRRIKAGLTFTTKCATGNESLVSKPCHVPSADIFYKLFGLPESNYAIAFRFSLQQVLDAAKNTSISSESEHGTLFLKGPHVTVNWDADGKRFTISGVYGF